MKNQFTEIPSFIVVFAVLCICSIPLILSSCTSNLDDKIEVIDKEEAEEEVSTGCTSGKLFNEKDGLVRIDLENPSVTPNGWNTSSSIIGFEGTGYLVWTGNDHFNTPGVGTIKFSINISNPGTYQFVWRSRIAAGTSNTDFNDSWLKIKGDDFYGEKNGTNERVYPRGSGKTPNPEGAGSDGWFKVYMNRVGEWFWRSSTSDNDPHDIFATFNAAGVYDVEISGRSKSHAIDQFVLFKIDNSLSDAQNATLSEIICK